MVDLLNAGSLRSRNPNIKGKNNKELKNEYR